MDYKIEVVDVAARPIVATKIRTNLSKIGSDIGCGFGSVMQTMESHSIAPAGQPLVVYLNMIDTESDFDIETCVPVEQAELASASDVYQRELKGGPTATTIHRGPYEELTHGYQALVQWIPQHGHVVVGPPRETYLSDPQVIAPSELLTRIEFPIGAAG